MLELPVFIGLRLLLNAKDNEKERKGKMASGDPAGTRTRNDSLGG